MNVIKWPLKIAKYSLITVSSILLGSVIMSSLLLFTHTGNQGLIAIVKQFESRLSIDLIEGSLFNSPRYENIGWFDGKTTINVESLDYQFKWSCLSTILCLQSFNVDGATITIAKKTEQVDPNVKLDTPPLVIDLPIEIRIDNVNLSRIKFSMEDLYVDLDKLTLQAKLSGNDVSLSSQINGLLITLPNGAESVVKSDKVAVTIGKKKVNLSVNSLPALLTADMLPMIKLPINLNVAPIIINQFKIVQNKQKLFELNRLKTAFIFKDTKLNISEFKLDIPETLVNLRGDINFIDDYPLNITIDGQIKKVKQLQPETLIRDLNYTIINKGSLSDLTSNLTLTNKINLKLVTHFDLLSDNLPHNIDLTWKNLNWPLIGQAQYASKQGNFSSKGSLLDHHINLQTEYAITDLPSGKVSLKTKGDLQQLQVETLKVETLGGVIDFAGVLSWKEKIDWLGQLKITNIDLKELGIAYNAQLSGVIKQQVAVTLYENSPPEWQFDFTELKINGELLTRPLTASGRISGNDKKGITFDKLTIINSENTFLINGLLAKQNNLDISLNVVDISHAILGTTGKIAGNVSLKGAQSELLVASKLTAQNLSYENYQLEKLTLNSIITLTPKSQLTLDLNASKLIIDKQVIDNIGLKINNKSIANENFQHQIELFVNSELLSTDLKLYVTQTDKELLAELNQAKLYLPYQTLTLVKPLNITQQNENIILTEHCWQARATKMGEMSQHKAGKLCVDEFNVGGSGNVVFDVDKYLLSNLNPFLPDEIKLSGVLSANADFEWEKDNKPKFKVNVISENMLLKINSDLKKHSFKDYLMKSFKIDVVGDDEDVFFDANIFSERLINVTLKGQLAPYKSIPTIESTVDINLPDFALLLPLIPQFEEFEGQLKSQLTITGKLKNPFINGSINIQNGYINSVNVPMKISELQAAVQINNTQATILGSFNSIDTNTTADQIADVPLLTNTLNFFDKSVKKVSKKLINLDKQQMMVRVKSKDEKLPGVAIIKGQFDWSKKLKGDLYFYAHKLEIYEYGKTGILLSPDIHLHLDDHISVKGELFIDKGKIVIKELPAGAISQSKDIIVVDVKEQDITPNLPIIIDLSLDMGQNFQLVALGLDSFIDGKLLIKKRLEKDLTINGEVNFVNGSYRSLGQQLVLQNSRVIFQGSPESPYLTIEAIRDPDKIEDSVIAGVRVRGTPDELELVIFSEPAMSQQQALSYLTRGKSLDSSSDNSTMANMLIDIAAGQSSGLMSSLGEGVGIKDLSLSSSGTGNDQSVGVRGEVAPGVEISYGVGVFDSFSIFAIRYEMFERFYVEASSGINQAVDAYYEWDWD
jgi:translocation and assembly module TamB